MLTWGMGPSGKKSPAVTLVWAVESLSISEVLEKVEWLSNLQAGSLKMPKLFKILKSTRDEMRHRTVHEKDWLEYEVKREAQLFATSSGSPWTLLTVTRWATMCFRGTGPSVEHCQRCSFVSLCISHCFLLKCKSQEERALSVHFTIGISP